MAGSRVDIVTSPFFLLMSTKDSSNLKWWQTSRNVERQSPKNNYNTVEPVYNDLYLAAVATL